MIKLPAVNSRAAVMLIAVITTLTAGFILGRYTAPRIAQKTEPAPEKLTLPPLPAFTPTMAGRKTGAEPKTGPQDSPSVTNENIVAALRNALGRLGSRRTFVEFGKL